MSIENGDGRNNSEDFSSKKQKLGDSFESDIMKQFAQFEKDIPDLLHTAKKINFYMESFITLFEKIYGLNTEDGKVAMHQVLLNPGEDHILLIQAFMSRDMSKMPDQTLGEIAKKIQEKFFQHLSSMNHSDFAKIWKDAQDQNTHATLVEKLKIIFEK